MTTYPYGGDSASTVAAPLVPFVVTHDGARVEGWALVDSGADQSYLPLPMAMAVGLTDLPLKAESMTGLGGQVPIPFVPGGVSVEVEGVSFRIDQFTGSANVAIFGREPFFRLFDVRFDQAGQSVTIEPIEGSVKLTEPSVREAVAA